MRSRLTVAWFVSLGLLLAACAGATPAPKPPEPPKPPTVPMAWLPAESQVIASLTLAPWRSTPLWAAWEQTQNKPGALPSWIDVTLIDSLAVGGQLAEQGKGSFVAAMNGRFEAGYLDKLAARDKAPAEKHGAFTFYVAEELRFLQTAPNVVVVCTADRADAVAARAAEGGETIAVASRTLVQSLGARLSSDDADLVLMAEDTTGEGKSQLEKQGARFGLKPLARDVVRAGLSVNLGDPVGLALAAETPNPEAAAQLKLAVDETLGAFSRNMFVGLLGLRPVLEALKASQDGSHVTVRGAMAEAEVRALFSKAASMIELAAKSGGGLPFSP